MRKVNLEVGLEDEDEETMEQHIFASGMLQNIGPVDISKRLFKKLGECENARKGRLRVHDYGYDWRLSPHLLSRKLVEFLEKLPSNQPGVPRRERGALVIAHSLGGLITRHAVNQRPELFSGVLYAGAPQRCVNVLGPLRNGDAVLLNEKVLTAQVNFSLRTTFVFLPEDGMCFVDKDTQEHHTIDFYNVDDWVKYRLSPCVADAPLPVPAPPKSSMSFGSLRTLSSSLPLRVRANSDTKRAPSSPQRPHSISFSEAAARLVESATASISKDRTLAPQLDSEPADPAAAASEPAQPSRARHIEYLRRTLEATKRFRAELAHKASHEAANAYPPHAVLYGKDTPTVWAARVSGREGISRADAYDDLVFRTGDGVVLAREAALPPGYSLARGGRISNDRGHITLLGDLNGVGRALGALVKARGKGVGFGIAGKEL
jgi:pimeloyl-ACP methyl ester carboxylesterase